jgi:hypothetical protein
VTTAERQLAIRPTDGSEAPDPVGALPPAGGGRGAAWPALRTVALAGTAYILLSLGVWWNVWTGHPSTVTTCGCGDSSLFQWFLAWPAYAISHGLDPWYASAMFYSHGINLLSNTAVVGVGMVLAPVTWLFGPIVTFNVAITLAPALSAFAMFVLLRRWVAWSPAAFFGGLLYGFSPFILIGLTDGHLMLSMAPMPPLLVLCLDELLVRQRRSPVIGGLLLGLVVTVQFFIGTETLALLCIAAAIGIVLTLIYEAIHRRDVLLRRVRHAALGLAWAAVTVAVLLAYPTWFAFAGPAHLSGPIWGSDLIYGGTNLHDFFLPAPSNAPQYLSLAHAVGGYQGLPLSSQYLGIGLTAVLVTGLVVWWRDPRLWLFAIVGVLSVALSKGRSPSGSATLWGFFVHLPLMDDVIPSRFLIVTYLCAAVMLGLIIDHTRTGIGRWTDVRGVTSADAPVRLATRWRPAGSWVAIGVALIAVLPILVYLADGLPFTTQSVELPTWFKTIGPHVASGAVVLAFPVPWALHQSSLTWQAVDGMSFAQVGGSGPESITSRAGKEKAGQKFLADVSIGGDWTITPNGVAISRQALDGWGVTTIVIPDTHSLPTYERLRAVRSAVVLMTAATGELPSRQADAWVWTDVDQSPPPVLSSSAALAVCNGGAQSGPVVSIERSASCVLATNSRP